MFFNFFSVSDILTPSFIEELKNYVEKADEFGKTGKFTEKRDACTDQLLVSVALYSVFKTIVIVL